MVKYEGVAVQLWNNLLEKAAEAKKSQMLPGTREKHLETTFTYVANYLISIFLTGTLLLIY